MQALSTIIKTLFAAIGLTLISQNISAQVFNPKREFRGAWMHTVGQSQYANQTTQQNQAYLRDQLDRLQQAGVNAVLFQVRPSADAFYPSELEPWSRYLTKDGKAPSPYWDPLQFVIDEAHARGMELHAWLNPYRVTTAKGQKLPKNHLYHREPHRFVTYAGDGKMYFDPGLPENRDFIVSVINDIVERYDVDGIHFDDYFYPYPANGKDFPDDKSYKKYGGGMDRGDWRRQNVDLLIQQISQNIRSSSRPWVRFGISPFGIWRNKSTDPTGSATNGLQNYDDLYADVLLWAREGWIDYLIPQLYWELEHKRAPTLVLVDWWANAVDPRCQVYVGQDVERTMKTPDIAPSNSPNQLEHKLKLSRSYTNIYGNCWWPGYSLTRDSQGSATALRNGAQSTPALVPAYPHLSATLPKAVSDVRLDGGRLVWQSPKPQGSVTDHVRYVVYCFANDDYDFSDANNIVAVTADNHYDVTMPGTYMVTALDRVNNESYPSRTVVVR